MQWVIWIPALALVTFALLQVRESLSAAHIVLALLVLVLGSSALGGRALGVTIAVLSFAVFNFFFVAPYHTFAVAARVDWLVLFAFLVTSIVATHLLAHAQRDAREARERADEVDRLAALGAEALNASRAEDALTAVAQMIRSSLDLARCEVHLLDDAGEVHLAAESGDAPLARAASEPPIARAPGLPDRANLLSWVARNGRPAAARRDGGLRFGEATATATQASVFFEVSDAQALLLPLSVRGRTVGVLVLVHHTTLRLDAARRRLLSALSYYAALGVERVRLSSQAEHAEALREADRLKDALLLSVSHDLRTPLTTIKALAHDLSSHGDDRALIIEAEADRLNRFVADLLDLSRLAGGAMAVNAELNAAEDLLGVALQRVSGAAGARTIHVALDTSEPLLVGRFDFQHALRIVVNLIENALKYSPTETAVELSVRRAGERGEFLEFVVADRGAGVPDRERERIFEPFYRPEGSPPDAGSAGLGLSIAQRLAQVQGGVVYHQPRSGGGSEFVFRAPGADVGALV